ncbi:MAG TPA: metal ABC transporter substrate-binding protein, partial [Lapillicoccus sp.]|uniref:metal ABC transporter substrate-binding protein n=1 Tax=Lapillicoccus sp. TaxID=1909287 RepID=UPI002F91C629
MPSAPPTLRRLLPALAAATTIVLSAAACGSGASGGTSAAEDVVVTSFYPIQFATQQITGGAVPVTVLTKPGAEPHDLELAPQDIGGMTKARLVVYADGFQPAVDEAVGLVDPAKVLDVADAAKLTLTLAEESGHAGETDPQHDDHGHSGSDPHFWLDPSRYAAVAEAISARLVKDDPRHAATYAKNTA